MSWRRAALIVVALGTTCVALAWALLGTLGADAATQPAPSPSAARDAVSLRQSGQVVRTSGTVRAARPLLGGQLVVVAGDDDAFAVRVLDRSFRPCPGARVELTGVITGPVGERVSGALRRDLGLGDRAPLLMASAVTATGRATCAGA